MKVSRAGVHAQHTARRQRASVCRAPFQPVLPHSRQLDQLLHMNERNEPEPIHSWTRASQKILLYFLCFFLINHSINFKQEIQWILHYKEFCLLDIRFAFSAKKNSLRMQMTRSLFLRPRFIIHIINEVNKIRAMKMTMLQKKCTQVIILSHFHQRRLASPLLGFSFIHPNLDPVHFLTQNEVAKMWI